MKELDPLSQASDEVSRDRALGEKLRPTLKQAIIYVLRGIQIDPIEPVILLLKDLLIIMIIALLRKMRLPENLGASTRVATSPHSAALSRVDSVLKVIGLFLPSRIMKEDAGDAREVINNLVEEGAPVWMIYTKLTSSVCWILLAAVREVLTVTKKKPN